MKHQLNPVAGFFDGLPIRDIPPDLIDAHGSKFRVIAAGQAANHIAAGSQTFNDRIAEKPAAAGYQHRGAG